MKQVAIAMQQHEAISLFKARTIPKHNIEITVDEFLENFKKEFTDVAFRCLGYQVEFMNPESWTLNQVLTALPITKSSELMQHYDNVVMTVLMRNMKSDSPIDLTNLFIRYMSITLPSKKPQSRSLGMRIPYDTFDSQAESRVMIGLSDAQRAMCIKTILINHVLSNNTLVVTLTKTDGVEHYEVPNTRMHLDFQSLTVTPMSPNIDKVNIPFDKITDVKESNGVVVVSANISEK